MVAKVPSNFDDDEQAKIIGELLKELPTQELPEQESDGLRLRPEATARRKS